MNRYPYSELGKYIKHKAEKKYFPDDGRFDVKCKLAGRVIKMYKARILYENATDWEREEICSKSSSCGLKCYIN
jgi:hypothetical protein